MLVEELGLRIMTDPGAFTLPLHEGVERLDAVLITHEHADHLHIPSLRVVLKNNPSAQVICNPSVGALLETEGIVHTVVGDGQLVEVKGVEIRGFGTAHARVHTSIPAAQNTGYFIGTRFWYPGDAFHMPERHPEIVALPTAGPWMKLSEAIDYALVLKPRTVFPVHDGIINSIGHDINKRIAGGMLEAQGIAYVEFDLNKEYDI